MKGLKNLQESCIRASGGNRKRGQNLMVDLIEEKQIKTGNLTLDNFKPRAFFDVMVENIEDYNLDSPKEVSEAISSTAFPTLMTKVISPIIFDEMELELGDAGKLVTERTATRPQENMLGFLGLDDLSLVPEQMPYPEIEFGEKKIQIKMDKFGGICSLTREAILFDQTGDLADKGRKIGELAGAKRHRHIIEKAIDGAINATGEAANTGLKYDGTNYRIYNTAHDGTGTGSEDIDGQTNNNYLSTQTFGTTALKTAYTYFGMLTNSKGRKLTTAYPTQLLVPSYLYLDADQLLNSPLNYDTSNNAITPSKFKGIQVLTSPWLDYATAPAGCSNGLTNISYYLGNFPKQLYWLWAWKPTIDTQTASSDSAFDRDVVMRTKLSYFGGCGHVDYRYTQRNIYTVAS